MITRALGAALSVSFMVFVASVLPGGVARADTEEHIASYDVSMRVASDGSMRVVENVVYVFGLEFNHGFTRDLTTRVRYDELHNRVFPVDHIKASSPSGAPDGLHVERKDGHTTIRIGDKDNDHVNGTQKYRISYRVEHVVTDHAELRWDVLNDTLQVPVSAATVRVEMPGRVTRSVCHTGPKAYQVPCGRMKGKADTAEFRATLPESSYAPLAVVVGMSSGSVSTRKVLVERPSWRTYFGPGIANLVGVGSAVAAVLILLLLFLAARRRGTRAPQPGRYVTLRPRRDGSVAFEPPGGLRPGETGVLVGEYAGVPEVVATVVDLAVRGYLVIDELGDGDWGLRLVRSPDPGLLPHERAFLDTVFAGMPPQVRLSSLRLNFYPTFDRMEELLYTDMEQRGLFSTRRPKTVRWAWRMVGIVSALAGLLVLLLLAAHVHIDFGLGAIALVLLGGGMIIFAGFLPGKTALGQRALAQVRAFRAEMGHVDFARVPEGSRTEIASRYLPYAIAFDQLDSWARAFSDIDAMSRRGAAGHGLAWLHLYDFGNHRPPDWLRGSMRVFTKFAGEALASRPRSVPGSVIGSGGGGASGGGGGGGGGTGSW